MKIRNRKVGSAVVLDVVGRLTIDEDSRVLRGRVAHLLNRGVNRVVLDLEGVSQLDASGVGQLVALFKWVRDAGGSLELRRVREFHRHILEVVNLLSVFRVDDCKTAVAKTGSTLPQFRLPLNPPRGRDGQLLAAQRL